MIARFFYIFFIIAISKIKAGSAQICTSEVNIEYVGTDISPVPVVASSIDACCGLCTSNPVCQAWNYLPRSQLCFLKYAIGSRRISVQQMFSGTKQQPSPFPSIEFRSTTTAPSNPVIIVTVTAAPVVLPVTILSTFSAPLTTTTTTPAVVRACFVETGINYPGNDMTESRGNVENAIDCCNLCGSTSGCLSFSYHVESQYCFLKNADLQQTNRQPNQDIVSGTLRIE